MNALVTLAPTPIAAVLLQWTALLGLCWIAHFVFRKRHARWRVILWRSALCFAIVLPVAQSLPLPVVEVTVEPRATPPELRSGSKEPFQATAPAPATPFSFIPPPKSAARKPRSPLRQLLLIRPSRPDRFRGERSFSLFG